MTPPLVSILIPTHRRPVLFAEAVRSAFAQDYPLQHLEVIAVHDGEPPEWGKVVLRPRLSLVSIRQGGQGAAINAAFARSRGTYVTVLQDDDTILPHKVPVLAAALDRDPTLGGVYSLPQYVEADGVTPRPTPERLRAYLLAHPQVDARVAAYHGLRIHGMATMFRRSAWLETGPWDASLVAGEEWEWHLRFLTSGHVLGAVDSVTTRYRVHPTQKSNRKRRGSTSRRAALAAIGARYGAVLAALRERPAPAEEDPWLEA